MFQNKLTYTKRLQILFVTLFFSSLLLVLHTLGIEQSLYWVFPWFDFVTHAIGGIALGSMLSLIPISLSLIFILALMVIFAWEIFEVYIVKIPIYTVEKFVVDTSVDVLVGIIFVLVTIHFLRR